MVCCALLLLMVLMALLLLLLLLLRRQMMWLRNQCSMLHCHQGLLLPLLVFQQLLLVLRLFLRRSQMVQAGLLYCGYPLQSRVLTWTCEGRHVQRVGCEANLLLAATAASVLLQGRQGQLCAATPAESQLAQLLAWPLLHCVRTTLLLLVVLLLLLWRQDRQPNSFLLQLLLLLLLLALLTQLLERQHLNVPTRQGLYCRPCRLLNSSS
jgi:hypothetical protein